MSSGTIHIIISTKQVKWPSKILSSTAHHQLSKAAWAFCPIWQNICDPLS